MSVVSPFDDPYIGASGDKFTSSECRAEQFPAGVLNGSTGSSPLSAGRPKLSLLWPSMPQPESSGATPSDGASRSLGLPRAATQRNPFPPVRIDMGKVLSQAELLSSEIPSAGYWTARSATEKPNVSSQHPLHLLRRHAEGSSSNSEWLKEPLWDPNSVKPRTPWSVPDTSCWLPAGPPSRTLYNAAPDSSCIAPLPIDEFGGAHRQGQMFIAARQPQDGWEQQVGDNSSPWMANSNNSKGGASETGYSQHGLVNSSLTPVKLPGFVDRRSTGSFFSHPFSAAKGALSARNSTYPAAPHDLHWILSSNHPHHSNRSNHSSYEMPPSNYSAPAVPPSIPRCDSTCCSDTPTGTGRSEVCVGKSRDWAGRSQQQQQSQDIFGRHTGGRPPVPVEEGDLPSYLTLPLPPLSPETPVPGRSSFETSGSLTPVGWPPYSRRRLLMQDYQQSAASLGDHLSLFIGNIPAEVSEEALMSVLTVKGEVAELIYGDPAPGVWMTAFVTYRSAAAARKAQEYLSNRKPFKNAPPHRLVCCYAPHPPASLCAAGGTAISEDMLGTFTSVMAYPKFEAPDKAEPWLGGVVDDIPPYSNACRKAPACRFALLKDGPPGANLFIYGIPSDWSEVTLMALCQRYGHIIGIRVPPAAQNPSAGSQRLNKGFGFVSYDTAQAGMTAKIGLSGRSFLGKNLSVQLKKGEQQKYELGKAYSMDASPCDTLASKSSDTIGAAPQTARAALEKGSTKALSSGLPYPREEGLPESRSGGDSGDLSIDQNCQIPDLPSARTIASLTTATTAATDPSAGASPRRDSISGMSPIRASGSSFIACTSESHGKMSDSTAESSPSDARNFPGRRNAKVELLEFADLYRQTTEKAATRNQNSVDMRSAAADASTVAAAGNLGALASSTLRLDPEFSASGVLASAISELVAAENGFTSSARLPEVSPSAKNVDVANSELFPGGGGGGSGGVESTRLQCSTAWYGENHSSSGDGLAQSAQLLHEGKGDNGAGSAQGVNLETLKLLLLQLVQDHAAGPEFLSSLGECHEQSAEVSFSASVSSDMFVERLASQLLLNGTALPADQLAASPLSFSEGSNCTLNPGFAEASDSGKKEDALTASTNMRVLQSILDSGFSDVFPS